MRRRVRERDGVDADGFPLALIRMPESVPGDLSCVHRFWAARRDWEATNGRALPAPLPRVDHGRTFDPGAI